MIKSFFLLFVRKSKKLRFFQHLFDNFKIPSEVILARSLFFICYIEIDL